MILILTLSAAARAEVKYLPAGTVIHHSTRTDIFLKLEEGRYLLKRADLENAVVGRKALRQCTQALGATEKKLCEDCDPTEAPLFGTIGLPTLVGIGIVGVAITLTAGILLGVEASRPATAMP